MSSHSKAKIYLADHRGCSQINFFRSYHTFNFDTFFNENKKPFGNLQVLNDDTLKGGSTLTFQTEKSSTILLLPIVGTLKYKTSAGEEGRVDAGQLHLFTVQENAAYELSNPYKDELINFLHCRIVVDASDHAHALTKFEFDLEENKNQLMSFYSDTKDLHQTDMACHIGRFDGRKEGVYRLTHPGEGIFIFVIEGAFEVQNRLLQARDGLALWDTEELEFEALSNDAILLLLEA
jgi:redox-sensitive bicupin YhaK (pirin superfamily)